MQHKLSSLPVRPFNAHVQEYITMGIITETSGGGQSMRMSIISTPALAQVRKHPSGREV